MQRIKERSTLRMSVATLRDLVESKDWIVGAVNYDEDLHFSSYYLRAGYCENTKDLYQGYSHHIAFYENCNEYYYLLAEECATNAQAIVDRAIQDPDWLPSLVSDIVRQSDLLGSVFSPHTSSELLNNLTNTELLSLYSYHDGINRSLYRVARVPEALDRGVSYFSNYLKNYLQQLGLNIEEVEDAFVVLTQPIAPSILAQELIEFESIVRSVDLFKIDAGILNKTTRARMFLSPGTLEKLEKHLRKWKYLEYHGYGRRETTTLASYIERLINQLREPNTVFNRQILAERLEQNKSAKDEYFSRLSVDEAHRSLFEIYPEIGAVKLYRRYAQLRNFYYLDMLISEIAERLQIDEWTTRCLLPEEIMNSLEKGRLIDTSLEERKDGCVFVMLNGQEYIIADIQAIKLRAKLHRKASSKRDKKVLKGTVASKGRIIGVCKVLIRADDQVSQFAKGSILVSESTDPDLMKFLSIAGGVLTEQGGVTSHAAIICRELGIPTIIGVEGLLEQIKDGDEVEVDAFTGEIKHLHKEHRIAEDLIYQAQYIYNANLIGAKAYNLGLLRRFEANVPDYALLSYEKAKHLVIHKLKEKLTLLIKWLTTNLNLSSTDFLALRSSAIGEDSQTSSFAGMYTSLLNIAPAAIPEALLEFIERNDTTHGAAQYRGSIIIQKMVPATFSGVCLTLDDRIGQNECLIIEVVPGNNFKLTDGTTIPTRIMINRLTGDIALEGNISIDTIDINKLKSQFLTLENKFGFPLDIEWGLLKEELYILQARPIVK